MVGKLEGIWRFGRLGNMCENNITVHLKAIK